MEGEESNLSQGPYPILFIPKVCTPLETNCEMSENVFIHVNISTPDTDGNDAIIYKGFCNVKVTKSNDINVTYGANDNDCKDIPVILAEANQISFPAYNDSQVWIDPARSPYVYNRCDSPPQEAYTIHETRDNHITIEQHNTYITQNVYNYNETVRYSPTSEEHKTVKKGRTDSYNMYEEDEFECGVFLSQLSEEIINEKEIRDRDERKFVGLKTDNEALKQLMSSDIQSASRQQKTILFLGHDAEYGQTIQNISLNDPTVECLGNSDREVEVTADDSKSVHPQAKRYQCNKCKQIFDQLAEFKQHMVGNHRLSNLCDVSDDVKFMCQECGKYLKNQDKFEKHCLGHGDPDLECDKCHKVFASKFTLRNHMKIHTRRYLCSYCPKSYGTPHQLYTHAEKSHFRFMCDFCPFVSDNYTELKAHKDEGHQNSSSSSKESSVSKYNEDLFEDISSDMSLADEVKQKRDDRIQTADSVIAKVMANRLFQELAKNKKTRKCKKVCDVCRKKFDRISDLKRHLIEHVIRSTLAKNPTDKYGVLTIRCEICQEKVFSKVDRYKAHLREHAKLTIYKCTFCDKSFSDSSNFSKHKKIHGSNNFFQCDMCQRKFNSKKMITQHMEYHKNHGPIKCQYCEKIFHFESMLNKHIKCAHSKETTSKFKCRVCERYFKSLKEKWDHEWNIHNVRKAIVDCLVCDSRFRKYSELKKHCNEEHEILIPPKKFLHWKMKDPALKC